MGSRVELFARIRRDARVEGLSIRELARRHQVGRRTVRQALMSAEPPERRPRVRLSPRLGPFKAAIDAMLTEDVTAPRKQRHTARRVLARLVDEHGASAVSYSSVRDYVRVRRAEIDVEAGRRVEVFVPQERSPGAEGEVDFGEVWVVLAGVKTKCHMFVFWSAFSGKAVHRVYPTQGQEAFLQGHIEAFEALGGVPTRHIRYDNLTSAVTAVLFGTDRRRTENERWVLFRSHYGFDAFYCQPGIAGAHEKGGVEGEVGRFRRNHLSPMPVVESLDELNERIRGWEADDDGRRIGDRLRTVGADFAVERPLLATAAGRGVRPGVGVAPEGGPVGVGDGADGQVLGAGPADWAAGPGLAAGQRGPRVRRATGRGPARPGRRPNRRGGAAGPLPRGAEVQAGGAARVDRVGSGQSEWVVHDGA